MSRYGLELFNAQGKRTLSIDDRLGRFLGSFTVPNVYQDQNKRFVFPIPSDKQGLGDVFLFFNVELRSIIDTYDTFFMCQSSVNIYVSGGREIIAEISVSNLRHFQEVLYIPSFKIMYGVA